MLARQIDHVVAEPKRDFWRREIGVVKGLRKDHVVVAVLNGAHAGAVGVDGEFPDLKRLTRHALFEALCERDFVEKPVRTAFVGDMFGTVCEQNVPAESMAVPPSVPMNWLRSASESLGVVVMDASWFE